MAHHQPRGGQRRSHRWLRARVAADPRRHVDSPDFARAADLLAQAATSLRPHGRPIYAALGALPTPSEVVARMFNAAALLRERRGDGHIAALMAERIRGTEAHILLALDMGMPARKFARVHHLPPPQLDAVIDGVRARGLMALRI